MVYKAIVSATNKPDKNTSECLNFFFKDRYRNKNRYFRHKEDVNSKGLS